MIYKKFWNGGISIATATTLAGSPPHPKTIPGGTAYGTNPGIRMKPFEILLEAMTSGFWIR